MRNTRDEDERHEADQSIYTLLTTQHEHDYGVWVSLMACTTKG